MDGTNSGNGGKSQLKDLPYEKCRRFVCVEYPGIVKNDKKAIETLGGIDRICKTYGDTNKRLDLQWRPRDVYSKPAFGDRTTSSSLLLKVKRRWKKDDPSQQHVSAEIMGPITTTYKYDAIGDFQYLPMHRKSDNTYKSLTDSLFINEPIDMDEFLSRDMPMFLPPSSFSRFDKASDYAFRPDIKHGPKYDDPSENRPSHLIGSCRSRRPTFAHFLSHESGPIPSNPIGAASSRMSKYMDKVVIARITQLFMERPLWTRPAIICEGEITDDQAKIILPAIAVYWCTGPWRKCWTRLGYDPRLRVDAKQYQVIDFRLRQKNIANKLKIVCKRSTMTPKLPYSSKVNRSAVSGSLKSSAAEIKIIESKGAETSQTKQKDRSVYVFRADTKPPYRQVYYQVCDVKLDQVQQLIASNDGQETDCDPVDGWCVKGTTALCRSIMTKSVMNLLQETESSGKITPDEVAMDEGNIEVDEGEDNSADEDMMDENLEETVSDNEKR